MYLTNIYFTAQFSSKDDNTRQEAALAFRSLAEQCSDHEAIEKIVTHLFGVLNGNYIYNKRCDVQKMSMRKWSDFDKT